MDAPPRLLLAAHLHKRRSNYFARRDYDVPSARYSRPIS